jgi:hypothetical protein
MGSPSSAPSDEDTISQAYAALERLYSEGRWSDAEAAGQALLAMDPEVLAHWRQRVLLVLGHTQLYGFADPAAAAAHYQQVLELGSDPMLRDIASAGLAQCQAMPAPEPPPTRPDATPWLTESPEDASAVVRATNPEQVTHPGKTTHLGQINNLVQANNPEQADSFGETNSLVQAAEMLFSGFVQPVQIAETAQTDFPPQQIVGEQVQEQLQKHLEQQLEEPFLEEPRQKPSSQPLSPEDQAELALGLLRVVIQAN